MGCCFSKKEASSWGKAASIVRQRRSPPPTEPEAPQEETVKEVLSETAKPRVRPREEVKEEEEVGIEKCLKAGPAVNSINGGYNERFEESSEVCGMSQGFSVSTTVTEKRGGEERDAEEVEGESRRTRGEKSQAKLQRKRSFSSEIARNKERSAGVGIGCRSGRASPSPVKRREGAVGRTYSAREAGQGLAARSRVPAAENGFRRDPRERSGRRSVSPAAKRAAGLRSAATGGQCKVVQASRANGRVSPRRIPPAAAATPDADGKRAQEASGGDGGEGKESLENPLVSLECFIFL